MDDIGIYIYEFTWRERYYNSSDKSVDRYEMKNMYTEVNCYNANNEYELREKQMERVDETWIKI